MKEPLPIFILINTTSGHISDRAPMSKEQAEARNEWLSKYGSPNVKWVTDYEAEFIQNQVFELSPPPSPAI